MMNTPKRIQNKEKTIELDAAALLEKSKAAYANLFKKKHTAFCKKTAKLNLKSSNSWLIIIEYRIWMIEWIQFSWNNVVKEKPLIIENLLSNSGQQIKYLDTTIQRKANEKVQLESFLLAPDGQEIPLEPAEKEYYYKRLKDLEVELLGLKKQLEALVEIVPYLNEKHINQNELEKHLVIFSRGGFGRGELTFSSDIDLGYCVDLSKLDVFHAKILEELIGRMNDNFNMIPLEFSSQYFKLHEDLKRFQKLEALHTLPSILESSLIFGNKNILKVLRNQIRNVVPIEKMIRYLKRQRTELRLVSNHEFDIKKGYGGLRHLHYAFWTILILEERLGGGTEELLRLGEQKGWITRMDVECILSVLEFYFDLRNFMGLYSFYIKELKHMGQFPVPDPDKIKLNYWDDTICLAYLKLKDRFLSVDFLDRHRLHAMHQVVKVSQKLFYGALDRTIKEKVSDFYIVKHLESLEILRLDVRNSAVNNKNYPLKKLKSYGKVLKLFEYISRTGNKLCSDLMQEISLIVEDIYLLPEGEKAEIKDLLTVIFTNEFSSVALEQMFEISAPISRDGKIKTLLGKFIPEVNEMRFVIRNINVHQYPMCIHSLKALRQMETEIQILSKKEPELWAFANKEDIFALKWSILFHDIGKIDLYKPHEEFGPVLSNKILIRLGWEEGSPVLDKIRLLVRHHQSVVRFSRLSRYFDHSMIQFIELAERDPRKLMMLYLVNLSDLKSVNEEIRSKTGPLEELFSNCLTAFDELRNQTPGTSLSVVVNDFLREKKNELEERIWFELLIQSCKAMGLTKALLEPLEKIDPQKVVQLKENRKSMDQTLRYLTLGGLTQKSMDKHTDQLVFAIKREVSVVDVKRLISSQEKVVNWLFQVFPNRLLLGLTPRKICNLLYQFSKYESEKETLTYFQDENNELNTLVFQSKNDSEFHQKISYLMGQYHLNIESGKLNQVQYKNGEIGITGFLHVITTKETGNVSIGEMEKQIETTQLSRVSLKKTSKEISPHLNIQYLLERNKSYLVCESEDGYKRDVQEKVALKISTEDASFSLFKMFKAIKKLGVIPQQVTITTIGEKIIDYFYITTKERDKLISKDFEKILQSYSESEVVFSHKDDFEK